MIESPLMQVTIDDKTFTITGRCWSATYPLHDIEKRLAIYRFAQRRFPTSPNEYNEVVKELERLVKEINA